MGLRQVDYGSMDPVKRAWLRAGLTTVDSIKRLGMREIPWTRGESYYAVKTRGGTLVGVPEGLGTKDDSANKMTEQLEVTLRVRKQLAKARHLRDRLTRLVGISCHKGVGQCNVAMNANDIITSGVSPAMFMMHLDVGPSWIGRSTERWKDLGRGTARGCIMAGCAWGGGETAELNTLPPDACSLSGMMAGFTTGDLINPASIEDGDALVGFESSGPHSNGYTGLRALAERLPNGYLTEVPGTGKTFGELILAPTYIYTDAIERCLALGARIHAIFNITGHAFCKLMRPIQPQSYVITDLPICPPIFHFIQGETGANDKKMLKTFNMGVGMVICVARRDLGKVLRAIREMRATHPSLYPFNAMAIGHVENSQAKSVHILDRNVDYGPEDLKIR